MNILMFLLKVSPTRTLVDIRSIRLTALFSCFAAQLPMTDDALAFH